MAPTLPEVWAAGVCPGVDLFSREGSFRWYRLVLGNGDLEPEECSYAWEGNLEDWNGSDGEWDLVTTLGLDWRPLRWLEWALQNGIAPEQEFLVWCSQIRGVRYDTMDGTEYDEEWEAEVVRALPTTCSARDLERVVDTIFRDRRCQEAERQELKRAQWADVERMYLKIGSYWPGGYCNEMAPPTGLIVSLCTSRWNLDPGYKGHVELVSGRSDRGDSSEAFAQLKAKIEDPKIVDIIDTLPRRRW